jgi:germination protein M
MNIKHPLRVTSVVGLLSLPLLLSGCSLFGNESASIDPPPSTTEQSMIKAVTGKAPVSTGQLRAVFLQDHNRLLAPVSLPIATGDVQADAKSALETLVEGGPYAGLLPEGFKGVLPQGTEVKSVTVDKKNKLAVVEFNKSFGSYKAQEERKLMESLTWTLTDRPDIQSVQIWVDGKKLKEMPVGGTPLDHPLTRAVGINLEVGHGVTPLDSSPVTVYFSSSSPAGVQYYVPVTRLVSPEKDRVQSALHQLIQGPQTQDGLQEVMTGETALKSVERSKDNVITVSLSDDMFAKGEAVPAEFLESVVLTAADNSEDAVKTKIRIELNGEKSVIGQNNQNYGEPVAKPQHINEIPL